MSCSYPLRSCVWEITLACCFSCNYCGSKAGCARENELTTDECLNIAKQLSDIGCRRVSLIGGEVFMRPDWPSIAKELTSRNVKVSIITNGYLFSEKLLNDIRNCSIESIAVSLDGPEAVHDRFRQKGSFKRAIEAIDVLSRNDIPVSVISTLHSENVSHLDEMYDILRQKEIFAWQLQACSPMGNAVREGVDYRFSMSEVIRFVEEHKDSAPFALGIADNIGYFTDSEGSLRGRANAPFTGCRAGLRSIGIDSVGNVRGCESMYAEEFVEGNLREKTLREIWENPNGFAYNRRFHPALLTGKCATCERATRCAGGCRSYNYFVHGKLYESPFCARNERKQ